ncbi:Glucose-1-phosphate adenylyltransferase [compost metagenome]
MNRDTQNNKIHIGIGNDCFIKNALIDKNVRIGNNVHINGGKHLENFTNELYSIKDGIVVIKKDAILPDNFRID